MLASVQGTVHGRLGLVSKSDCGSDATEAVMAQNRGRRSSASHSKSKGKLGQGGFGEGAGRSLMKAMLAPVTS